MYIRGHFESQNKKKGESLIGSVLKTKYMSVTQQIGNFFVFMHNNILKQYAALRYFSLGKFLKSDGMSCCMPFLSTNLLLVSMDTVSNFRASAYCCWRAILI